MAKLNISAGEHPLEGWMNVDIGGHPGTLRMDATQTFPFPSGEFSHIFTEHTLEHMPYGGAIRCLNECYRTLVPGGRLRVSIPHIGMLMRLYHKQHEPLEHAYIEWHCKNLAPGLPVCPETVWNNFYRSWGHQYMWSADRLITVMETVGFIVSGPLMLNESPDMQLRNLENDTRMPPGFLQLETVTFEGVKPYA